MSPDSPAIQDSLGWVLFRQGKIKEALPVLERAWRNSRDSEIAAHYGEALWKTGDEGQARYIWQQALHASPDDTAAARHDDAADRRGAAGTARNVVRACAAA